MLGPTAGLGTATDLKVDRGLTIHDVNASYLDDRGLCPQKVFSTSDLGLNGGFTPSAKAAFSPEVH